MKRIFLIALLIIFLILLAYVLYRRLNLANNSLIPKLNISKENSITLVKSGTISRLLTSYNYWIFENSKYPCGKQGNHQFIVIQKGNDKDKRHLMVRFVGGFAGFFYSQNGQKSYFPDRGLENLLYADTYTSSIAIQGLDRKIIDAKGWRIMSPSYCSHDLYFGKGQFNNEDGFSRWGYPAVSEAIGFTQKYFPTDQMIMYGTSAGSSGAFYQGIKYSNTSGIIMDSFAVDLEPFISSCEKGIQPYYSKWPCTCNNQTCVRTLAQRIGMTLNDAPYLSIKKGLVNTPVYVIFNQNDYLYNSHVDLEFSNIRQAIKMNNPGGQSEVSEVCIDDPKLPNEHCNMHSPTLADNSAALDAYNWIISIVGQ